MKVGDSAMAAQMQSGNSVAVTIYGRTYHLRGDGQAEHLTALAERVDRTMREIAEKTGTADTLKVAILAALNIADESANPSQTTSGLDKEATESLDRCLELIEDVMQDYPAEVV